MSFRGGSREIEELSDSLIGVFSFVPRPPRAA
jgi:hypothetical protein